MYKISRVGVDIRLEILNWYYWAETDNNIVNGDDKKNVGA